MAPYAPSFDSMCPPPKSRSASQGSARVNEPEGNLAVALPDPEPEELEPESSAVAEDFGDEVAEPEVEPIAAGLLRYGDATPQQRERARAELQDRIAAYLNKARARVVITDNLQTMLSVKGARGVLTFRVHHMFVGAPAAVTRALARYAETHDRDSATLLRRYADANEELIRRRQNPRTITLDTEGRYHNLQEIFDELNDEYFGGAIKARITWGARSKRRRSRSSISLGRYIFDDELIRIHPVLDARDVPRFFIAWIIYHEMLHELHGLPVVDGRRQHHPPAFRRDEEKFEHYVEAVMWERTHARKLLER